MKTNKEKLTTLLLSPIGGVVVAPLVLLVVLLKAWLLYAIWTQLALPIFAEHGIILPTITYGQFMGASIILDVVKRLFVALKYDDDTDKNFAELTTAIGYTVGLAISCYIINWIWL